MMPFNSMKKLFFLSILSFTCYVLTAQSFYKNALVFDAKLGLDVYNTTYYYKLKSSGLDTTKYDKAANRNFSFGLEYGVLNRLGVGIRAKFNRYFVSEDDVTKKMPDVTSLDYMATVNFHAVKGNVFNLITGFNIGGSSLKLITNDINNTKVYGNGMYFDLHITPRIYIKRFGFQFDLSMPFINYNKLTTNNADFNNQVLAKWKGLGYNFGVGIQYRFLSSK